MKIHMLRNIGGNSTVPGPSEVRSLWPLQLEIQYPELRRRICVTWHLDSFTYISSREFNAVITEPELIWTEWKKNPENVQINCTSRKLSFISLSYQGTRFSKCPNVLIRKRAKAYHFLIQEPSIAIDEVVAVFMIGCPGIFILYIYRGLDCMGPRWTRCWKLKYAGLWRYKINSRHWASYLGH
jgi:hypothetical protein